MPGPPALGPNYLVPPQEVVRNGKQVAVDLVYQLTNYEEFDDPRSRFRNIAGEEGMADLAAAAAPLTHWGRWSRGEVVYPQLGGLTDDKTSVMTVVRQTIGSGAEEEFTLVRTLDVRLVKGPNGWEFDRLASAGGVFASVEDLELAHEVAADPRIEMADSARLDILDGKISPMLMKVMLDVADITPYAITVMATGHPYHVFETNRVSHHTVGRAIDIHRVGDRQVIDDREEGSPTWDLVWWMWQNNEIVQVGSPWDVDAPGKRRSFVNTVHQDHIHMAVVGPNDPLWVPALGGRVWDDLDADGLQDDGEPGLGGITVRLVDGGGTQRGSTTTDANGAYEFRNLRWGDWRVRIDVPTGHRASPRNRGGDDTIDSDIDGNGAMPETFLDPREHEPHWDAGLYRRASIGDLVWEDVDGDGVRDDGEPGVSGVTVRLYDADGAEVASTTTNADGVYGFSDLTPGTYHVEVDLPSGFVATLRDRGSDDGLDSDVDAGGVMAATTLTSNEQDRRWDAGLVRLTSIGDYVWQDLNGDGLQNGGEPGLNNVTVRLLTSGGSQVAATTTDANGEFEFTGVRPGVYRLEVEVPDGFAATTRNAGSDDSKDSDIDAEGRTEATRLTSGEADDEWDAGLVVAPTP
ncbi:MAG: SdrD B-like domain-containing protein [Acidimicrobiia bacterium]|nr:SdrD B-like domain-containing protein [Acidimicrobiia bacterium]